MGTSNRDFRIKNGLIVDGASATVNGNNVLTSASSINDLGDVVITDPSTGQVIKWNGTAWINDTDATGAGGAGNSFTTIDVPNGTDPVADSATDTLTFSDGANITITGDSSTDTVTVAVDADLTGITSILTPNYIGLDTTPTGVPGTQGTLAWNPDQETLDIQLDTNVVLPVGQKHVIRVKNNSGSVAIPKGRVVSFAGSAGDTVKVTPAISTATYEPHTLVGVTSEEIPADGFGFVTQYGFVRGIDTNSFTLGDLLYVDPASPGVLTKVLPTAPNWTFPIAAVTKVNESSGIILVRIIPGSHLHDIVDVAISSPADNEVLAYNNESGTWINQTASEAGLVAEGDARLTDARTPTAHATSHGSAGTDAITIAQSQVTGLETSLGEKAPIASPTFTGTVTLPGVPNSSLEAATKQYVDDVAQGLHIHPSVVAATTANLTATYSNGTDGVGATLTNSGTLVEFSTDGVSPAQNNRVLVKNQTTQLQNGIYTLTTVGSDSVAWVLTRATDMDQNVEIDGGDFVFVTGGSTLDNTGWVQTETVTTVGTDLLIFTQFSGAGTYLAGTGLTLTGNTFSINTGTTVDLNTAQALTNKTISGENNTLTVRVANDVSGLGSGVATFLATPTSANLAAAVTDETGSGALVFANAPTFTGTVTTSNGITNAQAKNALVASGYNSASGAFAQASRVIMTATGTSSANPTTRPDGTTLQIGDIWLDFA